MGMLEHNLSKPEKNVSSDVKKTKDIKPPKEIGETEEMSSYSPREIGENDSQNDLPKEIDDRDISEEKIEGGSYRDCKKISDGDTQDVHHVPAKDVSPLSENDGPCIIMEREDHKLTASYGISKEAQQYRAKQKELIDQGQFRKAFEMDKKDIQSKFGDKYDKALSQAEQYITKLETGGVIK